MITILCASVLGSWTYAGFLTRPAPAPAPDATPPPASAPLAPAKREEARKKPVDATPAAPSAPSKPEEKPKTAVAPKAPPPPALYRLADASGQAWEHGDPAYLSSFVEARNRSLATPAATYFTAPAQGYRSSRCYGGRCN